MAEALNLTASLNACPPDEEARRDRDLEAYLENFENAQDYEPWPHQQEFHEMESARKAAIGGLGMGKSAMSTMEALYHAWDYNGDIPHVGIMGAPTYPMIRDVLLPAFRQLWPKQVLRGESWESAFVKSEMVLYLANGSAVFFRSLDGDRYERLRGIEYVGWYGVDEACLLRTEAAWLVGIGRIRYRKVRVRSAWLTTTPKGEDWVADRFIINPREGYGCVRGTTHMNRALADGYVEELTAEYDDRFREQEVEGKIVSAQGAVYPRLSRHEWPDGNTYRVEVQRDAVTYLAVDFGRLNPRALFLQTLQALHPETRRYVELDVVVGEVTAPGGKPPSDWLVEDLADAVKAEGFNVRVIYGDPAGDSRNEHTHKSSAQKLRLALGRREFVKPAQSWRNKQRGETLVAGRICASDGARRLVWASSGVAHPLGGYYTAAENSYRAHASLRYPDRKPGKPVPNESEKDGVYDHDTDAMRYYLVSRHGKAPRKWAPMGGMVD